MRTIRLYLPSIVITLWAIALLVFEFGHVVRAVAWLTIAWALKIQIDEALHHKDDPHRRSL